MSLSLFGKQDVYLEIADRYRQYILNGIYKNGEKIPSVRAVATELGVNPNTVANAYSLLEKEGFVKILLKKGAYVIYDGDVCKRGSLQEPHKTIAELKNKGYSYEELIKALTEVFGIND